MRCRNERNDARSDLAKRPLLQFNAEERKGSYRPVLIIPIAALYVRAVLFDHSGLNHGSICSSG